MTAKKDRRYGKKFGRRVELDENILGLSDGSAAESTSYTVIV